MKGKLKRTKGHFKEGHQPVLKGKKISFGSKLKELKSTYIRLPKSTFEKVKSVPRSVKLFTANDERPKYCDSPMFLRSRKNSSILDPENINTDNTAR